MRKTFLGISVAALFVLFASVANAFEPGQVVDAGAFCFKVDSDFMKDFTRKLMNEGPAGYASILSDSSNECYDLRVHSQLMNGGPLRVMLDKKLWVFNPPNSTAPLEMWSMHDSEGVVGYTWLPAPTDDPEA